MKASAASAFSYVHCTHTKNYGVSFPIMAKSDVNGDNANEVFKFLKHAKPGLIRDLITERTDPVLFGYSYDYVGDLSETVALMWPKATGASHNESLLGYPSPQPSPARGEGAG